MLPAVPSAAPAASAGRLVLIGAVAGTQQPPDSEGTFRSRVLCCCSGWFIMIQTAPVVGTPFLSGDWVDQRARVSLAVKGEVTAEDCWPRSTDTVSSSPNCRLQTWTLPGNRCRTKTPFATETVGDSEARGPSAGLQGATSTPRGQTLGSGDTAGSQDSSEGTLLHALQRW